MGHPHCRWTRQGCTGSAVVACDEDDVGVRLGDTSGDGSDSNFGDELHVDAGARVGVLQVMDQLSEVFDRVDVMVRRRETSPTPGSGVANFGNPWIDLGAREFAPFAGLSALRNLDLDLVGIDEVFAGDAEAAGRDLFDGGAFAVTILHRFKAFWIFATFTGVRLAADTVHRDGEGLVGFLRNGAVGHRTGLEALSDGFNRFDLVDRDGLTVAAELHQATEG